MKPDTRRVLFDVPGVYRIRVLGRLDKRGVESFSCMPRFRCHVRGTPPKTTITGSLIDQASLLSILTQLYDMGYPLLDVKRLAEETVLTPPG